MLWSLKGSATVGSFCDLQAHGFSVCHFLRTISRHVLFLERGRLACRLELSAIQRFLLLAVAIPTGFYAKSFGKIQKDLSNVEEKNWQIEKLKKSER